MNQALGAIKTVIQRMPVPAESLKTGVSARAGSRTIRRSQKLGPSPCNGGWQALISLLRIISENPNRHRPIHARFRETKYRRSPRQHVDSGIPKPPVFSPAKRTLGLPLLSQYDNRFA